MSAQSAAQLRARADQLRGDLETARDALELAQGDVAEGSGSLEMLTEAQARVSGLEGAMKIVDQRAQAQASLEAEQAAAQRRAAMVSEMVSAAGIASESWGLVPTLIREATEQLEPFFQTLLQELNTQITARGRFAAAAVALEPRSCLPWNQRPGDGGLGRVDDPAGDYRADALLQEVSAQVDTKAVLLPLQQFGPKLRGDGAAPTLRMQSKLELELWRLWLTWQAQQPGRVEYSQIYLEGPKG